METPVITIHDTDLQALAVVLDGDVITARPGAFTLGEQYANGQVATIQRTIEGVASENLARFERYGSTWRILELTDEASSALDKVGREDHPCFQHAVDVIHERFWDDGALSVADVYKAAQKAGMRQELLDAFVLAKLNYQVCNGGFAQWVDNGYAVLYRETRESLKRIGTEVAWKTWELLGTLEEHLDDAWSFKEEKEGDYEEDCVECAGSGKMFEEDSDCYEEFLVCDHCGGDGSVTCSGSTYSPGYEQSERIDDDFYAINKTLVEEVESYVRGCSLDRVDPREETSIKVTCRYPNVKVRLIGEDGNAMMIVGAVRKALRRAGVSQAELDAYSNEAISGDYNHVLSTTTKWVVIE